MSALTKTFVVLLVVVSLLLSAGVIVYVNHSENFRQELVAYQKQTSQMTAAAAQNKSLIASLESSLSAATKDRDTLATKNQELFVANQAATVETAGVRADAASTARVAAASLATTTQALEASEQARNAQATVIASTRTANDDLKGKNSDLNLRVSDLTNRLDVVTRQFTNSQEQLTESRSQVALLTGQIKDAGLKTPTTSAGSATGFGAPPIAASVVRTTSDNGMTYVTISAGTKDQVTKGMKFQLFDRAKSLYLGELTVEATDESTSTGKIEGPHLAEVHNGTEVRTQL